MPTRPRLPRHLGVIPDGNRRWAVGRGFGKRDGYDAGVEPGLRLIERCEALGIEEVSAYGFTKENVRRPADQVAAFSGACVALGLAAVAHGAAVLAVGDCRSPLFPEALRPYAKRRSPGRLRFNLLVNYGWQWDVRQAAGAGTRSLPDALGSRGVSRIDLVIRWGGRMRLSGFLPMQTAYADLYALETLWPDMAVRELDTALDWYACQDVTLGG